MGVRADSIATIAAFIGVPLAGILFVAHLSSKRKTLKAGKEYQVSFNIKPQLTSDVAIEGFKNGLIQSGATSLSINAGGGSFVTHPLADRVMVLDQPEFTIPIQGIPTSVIPTSVLEI